jgi:hypothetical protein
MGAKTTSKDDARKACGRSRVSNGKTLFLEAVDGRSLMARRYRDVLAQLVSDLGGDPTEAQSLIARRAATLAVWCEQEEAALASGNKFSIGEYTSAANTMHRLLSALGLERRMRDVTPTIDSYLNGARGHD